MKIYDTMISDQYCLSWSGLDGVREFITNALDSDHEFQWSYNGDVLSIITIDFTLKYKYLMMGVSENRNNKDSVGRHGEGSLVSMGVLLREGYGITVYTGDKVWTPKFIYSEETEVNQLAIVESDWDTPDGNFRVDISNVDEGMLEKIKERCLYMQDDIGETIDTDLGRVLKDRQGTLFVGGIWVQDTGLKYGYDFPPSGLPLNRDRQSVNGWDLGRATSNLWKISKQPKLLAQMLDEGDEDVSYLEYNMLGLDKEIISEVELLYNDKYQGKRLADDFNQQQEQISKGYEGVCTTGNSAFNSVARLAPSYGSKSNIVHVNTPLEELHSLLSLVESEYTLNETIDALRILVGDFEARGVKWK